MSISSSVDRGLNFLLTGAALAIAATLVFRQVRGQPTQPAQLANQTAPTRVTNWQKLLDESRSSDSSAAPVSVVVFSDFQCPACKRLHATLQRLKTAVPDTFSVRLIHFPLSQHKDAVEAAALFECIRDRAVPDSISSVLYSAQDSLGLLAWPLLANRAKSPISAGQLGACMTDAKTQAQIAAHVDLGEEFGVMYTPTVVINGWRVNGTPSTALLAKYVRAAAAGRELREVADASR
jgi:protein-disulfide isomerase